VLFIFKWGGDRDYWHKINFKCDPGDREFKSRQDGKGVIKPEEVRENSTVDRNLEGSVLVYSGICGKASITLRDLSRHKEALHTSQLKFYCHSSVSPRIVGKINVDLISANKMSSNSPLTSLYYFHSFCRCESFSYDPNYIIIIQCPSSTSVGASVTVCQDRTTHKRGSSQS